MKTEDINAFLVSLGVAVDDDSLRKWVAVLANATLQVMNLGASVGGVLSQVMNFTTGVAQGLETLSTTAQHSGTSLTLLQQIGYAITQAGGDAETAYTALGNMVQTLRTDPQAENTLQQMGVATRDAKGQQRDTGNIFIDAAQHLSQVPENQARAQAQTLGIDEKTLMAMRQSLTQFSADYAGTAQAIGFSAEAAAVSSNRFMVALHGLGMTTDLLQNRIGAELAEGLATRLERFRRLIVDNFAVFDPLINGAVTVFVWFADVVNTVATQLFQAIAGLMTWWSSLDGSTRQVIATLGAMAAAVAVLYSAFAASPLGGIIALATALAALVEDYNIWRSGGTSLIDWSAWAPGIEYAIAGISSLGGDLMALLGHVEALGSAVWGAISAFLAFIHLDTAQFSAKGLFDQIIESVRSTIKVVGALIDALGKLVSGDFTGAYEAIKQAAISAVTSPAVQNAHAAIETVIDNAATTLKSALPEALGGTPSALSGTASGEERQTGEQVPQHAQGTRPQGMPAGLPGAVANTETPPALRRLENPDATVQQLTSWWQVNSAQFDRTLTTYNNGMGNVQKYGLALMPTEPRNDLPPTHTPQTAPVLQQETHIYVSGGGDTRSTATEVANQQEGVNSRLVQQVTMGNR